jgi:hypothetical protein
VTDASYVEEWCVRLERRLADLEELTRETIREVGYRLDDLERRMARLERRPNA